VAGGERACALREQGGWFVGEIVARRENRKWDPYGNSFLYFLNRTRRTNAGRNLHAAMHGVGDGEQKKACAHINIYIEEGCGETVKSTTGGSYATK
jgi:hypothetical protein